jgi:hypothetical protein
MQKIVKRWLLLSLATFALAATANVASADATASATTTGDSGILSGNAIPIALNIPINACGDAVSILGGALASGNSCVNQGGGSAGATATTTGDLGLLSGNAIPITVNAPINACGDAVSILGLSSASNNTCQS